MMRILSYFLKMLNSATKEFEVVAKYLPVKYFARNSPKDFHIFAFLFFHRFLLDPSTIKPPD